MRHAISVLLQNEVGALTRMTGMFSSRGYNIDSLNVAPTQELVDVVNIHDMTLGEHFERELAIVKIKLAADGPAVIERLQDEFGAELLDDSAVSCTLQLTGRVGQIDEFVRAADAAGEVSAVARSGSVAVSKGEVTLSTFDLHHRLSS